jgi:hypothetical protein
MPYLPNGNARDYLENHPDGQMAIVCRLYVFHYSSRFRLPFMCHFQLYDISLGLVHLHSNQIIQTFESGTLL